MVRTSVIDRTSLVFYDKNTHTSKCLTCGFLLKGKLLGNIKRHYIKKHKYIFDTSTRQKRNIRKLNVRTSSEHNSNEYIDDERQHIKQEAPISIFDPLNFVGVSLSSHPLERHTLDPHQLNSHPLNSLPLDPRPFDSLPLDSHITDSHQNSNADDKFEEDQQHQLQYQSERQQQQQPNTHFQVKAKSLKQLLSNNTSTPLPSMSYVDNAEQFDFEKCILDVNDKILKEKIKQNKILKRQNKILSKTRKEQKKQTTILNKLLQQLVDKCA